MRKGISISFAWVIIFLVAALLVPNVAREDLKLFNGIVVENKRLSGSGSSLRVQSKDVHELCVLIPNSTKENNYVVKNIHNGDLVDILYSDQYALKDDCYEAWELKFKGKAVISYEEVASTGKFYVRFFLYCAFFSFLFLAFFIFKRLRRL